MMTRITVARCGAVAALVALSACSSGGSGAAPSVAVVGKPAPNWTETTYSGSKLSLGSLRGKPVYLNFFATWCPPCNEEAPGINKLAQRYAARGLQVVGIDELESAKKAAEFVRLHHLSYQAVADDNGTLQTQYSINGLPVHVFIDRSGVIRKMVAGEMSDREIENAIQSIL